MFTAREQERCDERVRDLKAACQARDAAHCEIGFLDQLAHYEAHKGCGLRIYKPLKGCHDGNSAFRPGDIIYHQASQPSASPYVALVFNARSAYGFGGRDCVPTGELEVLMWSGLQFGSRQCVSQAESVKWMLMPPCCGRGAACPHLLSTEDPQWPDGSSLDLTSLAGIPDVFADLIETGLRQPSWQQQHALRNHFKSLLQQCVLQPADSALQLSSCSQAAEQGDENEQSARNVTTDRDLTPLSPKAKRQKSTPACRRGSESEGEQSGSDVSICESGSDDELDSQFDSDSDGDVF